MSNQHQLVISNKKYPDGLHIVECQQCDYAFAAEYDEHGIINLSTKVSINYGDLNASHSYFQTPEFKLELSVGAKANPKTSIEH